MLYQVGELFGYLGTADVLGTDPTPCRQPVTLAGEWTRQSAAISGETTAVAGAAGVQLGELPERRSRHVPRSHALPRSG